LKFYWNPTSPFVRKVSVTILELGLDDRVARVHTNPRDEASGFWSKNPLAKVPALETDKGEVLYDSPVICAFLDEEFGRGRLLPAKGGERWRVQTLAALADGILDAGLLVRQEGMRPADEQSPAWVEKQYAIARRGMDRLEQAAAAFQDRVDHATIAAGCAIGWLRFRHGQIEWLAGRPNLARWFASFSQRPSMQATAPA
jgi:glutathione S-transferase